MDVSSPDAPKVLRRKILKRPVAVVPAEVPAAVVPSVVPVIVRRVNEIASEILGDSFRPRENNLTIGKIVIPPELIAKWE